MEFYFSFANFYEEGCSIRNARLILTFAKQEFLWYQQVVHWFLCYHSNVNRALVTAELLKYKIPT